MDKFKLFKESKIEKDEMLILYIIFEQNEVSLEQLLSLNIINMKEKINSLMLKGYIEVDFKNNTLKPLKNSVNLEEKLTIENIDELRIMLNREIKNYELEKLKEWVKEYSFEKIKEATYKSMIKNIDNFNYIEKVLYNNDTKGNQEHSNLKNNSRKFDFFN